MYHDNHYFFKVPLTHSDFYDVMRDFKAPSNPAPSVTESMMKECLPNIENTHDEIYGIPTITDMGMEEPTTVSAFRGGETHALLRLKKKMEDAQLYESRFFTLAITV